MHTAQELEASVLLFGSPSEERRVSVASAQFVASRLRGRLWFWTPAGEVVELSREELAAHPDAFVRDFEPKGTRRFGSVDAALDTLAKDAAPVFLCLHGGAGENGELQRRLEARGLAFTGSGSRASELAFNKSEALAIARDNGLRTARGLVFRADDARQAREAIADGLAKLGRMVLKPESGGSSIGLVFVRGAIDAEAAAGLLAQNRGVPFRAEELIVGREFTIGVIERAGERGELALPCSEVVMNAGRNFDYEGKYLGQGSQEITPADVAPELRDRLHRAALTIHRALGCRGYSRSDFMVDAEGPVFLETNTLPGLTVRSFIPQQLEAAGIPFEAFLADQLAIAVARRKAHASAG